MTQFYRFTTRSSHVSLDTEKKHVFNYPVLSSNQKEDLESFSYSCCSLQSKTLHRVWCSLGGVPDPAGISTVKHCLKTKVPQTRVLCGEKTFNMSLRSISPFMQGRMGLVRVTSLKTQNLSNNLLQPSFSVIPRKGNHKTWALHWNEAFFCALHQVFRLKLPFPVTCNAKALCYVGPRIFRPGDLITIYSNWHMLLKYKY